MATQTAFSGEVQDRISKEKGQPPHRIPALNMPCRRQSHSKKAMHAGELQRTEEYPAREGFGMKGRQIRPGADVPLAISCRLDGGAVFVGARSALGTTGHYR